MAQNPNQEGFPDLVIGIDFGMTYTGVAWTNLKDGHSIQAMRAWPGLADGHESKVPTKIGYPRGDNEISWGFLCDADDEYYENADVHEHFKIYLDQASIDHAHNNGIKNIPSTVDEAQSLVTDYLKQVYRQIKLHMESTTGSWKDKRIEFIFSLPTTWTSLDTANRFHDAIRAAGFNEDNPSKHSTQLELTEAEAVAVYMATNPQVTLASRDIVLVCDAGGGTTDLGLVEVLNPNPNAPELRQVAAVKGVGIGSTMIDGAFEDLVQARLEEHPQEVPLPIDLAYKLARSTAFQSIKHTFGIKASNHTNYSLRLDKLGLDISRDLSCSALRIDAGKMQFSRYEIQTLFDVQIKGIIGQINKQLNWMKTNKSEDQVNFLILSGGLGGSAYVKEKIEEHFAPRTHPNAKNLHILTSQEPRLAVVKGLVMDRRQKWKYGGAALKQRIARASYGVMCKVPYDPKIHVGAEVVPDQYIKNMKWATKQISWLIKKGDVIQTDSAISYPFSRKIAPDDTNRTWQISIIISQLDATALPKSTKEPGASILCHVTSDFSEVDINEFEMHKNKKFWSSKAKHYYAMSFDLRIIIAPADLKFELWFKNKRFNKSHDTVTVEWDEQGAAVRPPEKEDDSADWEAATPIPAPALRKPKSTFGLFDARQ